MAASGGRRATGRRSTASSRRCAVSRAIRLCSSSRASRSACSAPMRDAPRVLIANSNLVPHWATWDCFNELDRKGLMMYGQMTAGSWIYIGSQGIVQGTYETFVEMGRRHYRRRPSRTMDSHRRPRRHGRRAAARRVNGRRFAARDRVSPLEHRIPVAHRLYRRPGQGPRRRARDHRKGDEGEEGRFGRAARQCRRGAAGTSAPRRQARHRHRPDFGP